MLLELKPLRGLLFLMFDVYGAKALILLAILVLFDNFGAKTVILLVMLVAFGSWELPVMLSF